MRRSVWIFVFCICVLGLAASTASAKTPDGQTPSVETICDIYSGAAFGLCNAYCEAMDCTDPNQHASNTGCGSVKRNFEKKTGDPLPCGPCVCAETLDLFADIDRGSADITRCQAINGQFIVVTTCVVRASDGTCISEDVAKVLFDGSTTPTFTCSATNGGLPIALTEAQYKACAFNLAKAAERQNVSCFIE